MIVSAPEPITDTHDCEAFSSGTPTLDVWLKRRALANQAADATRSYVSCADSRVIGYYALSTASVELAAGVGSFRRNMPDPIPAIVLARLAVDAAWQSKGLGRALFRDAALRVLAAAAIVGTRGMIVHAISAEARAFYEAVGMRASPLEAMTLMVTCAELRRSAS